MNNSSELISRLRASSEQLLVSPSPTLRSIESASRKARHRNAAAAIGSCVLIVCGAAGAVSLHDERLERSVDPGDASSDQSMPTVEDLQCGTDRRQGRDLAPMEGARYFNSPRAAAEFYLGSDFRIGENGDGVVVAVASSAGGGGKLDILTLIETATKGGRWTVYAIVACPNVELPFNGAA